MRGAFQLRAAALAALFAVVGCSGSDAADGPHASSSAAVRIADDLPVLHANLAHAARPPDVVRAVYDFAARHPEVLQYVPCFCGCDRVGHRGNEDCFVSKRSASGQVAEWEPHGLVCEICLDVGQMAMQMHDEGATTAAIREAVERRFANEPNHTPTPMPPGMSH